MSQELSAFIRDEMGKRKMSARQFADFLDVAPSTVTAHMKEDSTAEPTLVFLQKLAKQTNVPLAVIIAMAFPEVAGEISDIPPDILLIATRLTNLPEAIRDVVKRLVSGD